jgi:hypothetical protein
VILFWNWLQLPTSSSWICSTPILSPRNPSEPPPDPNPRSSFPQAQIYNGGSKSSCSGKFHPRKLHSALSFRFFTSDFSLRLFVTGALHWAFDSHWDQFDILFPRSCGNFRSPRVHCSRIQENPLQNGFIQASVVTRRLQELAFAPNCRLEKLV